MPTLLDDLLASPPLLRIRRNHALEHATIHVLSQRRPRTLLIGRSDPSGFFLYGEVDTKEVERALTEAQARLRQGERHLALHPNCGTTYLTAGALAGGAAFFSLLGGRGRCWADRLARLPIVMLAATLAVVLAQPLGLALQQRLTTQADLGSLQVRSVQRRTFGRATIHRILTSD
ncbi:MAG: DUF6391 domain-containing protein [Chloroflexota bacterium]